MLRISVLIILAVLLIGFSTALAVDKQTARVEKIVEGNAKEIRFNYNFSTVDTCIIRHDIGFAWQIDGWVYGEELYKNFLDPSLTCDKPYPFTVTEINMPMVFATATTMSVSVDVEAANLTNPSCPFPDTLIAMSSTFEVTIPDAGAYNIWIELDTPVEVDGPFFAGFYIATVIDESVGAAIITDSNTTTLCASYNIWDDSIGFVDLNNNNIWNFPGRLVLYAAGIPGGNEGGGAQPEPEVKINTPAFLEKLFGSTTIWIDEISGSNIIEYVSFEYSDGGPFVEIGRDYDGLSTSRDGVNPTTAGDGFSIDWDFSALSEGNYSIRATAFDTLGRSASDDVAVFLEPTPPTAKLISPANGSVFCDELTLLVDNNDEDLIDVTFYQKNSMPEYSSGLSGQQLAPFIDSYNGSLAGALLFKLWFDRGYNSLMRDGLSFITVDTLISKLAVLSDAGNGSGSDDDALFAAIKEYNRVKGNFLNLSFKPYPDYFDLRRVLEDEEKAVMIGLGGNVGVWLALDGFSGWEKPGNMFLLRYNNPATGLIDTISMRDNSGIYELNYGGQWLRLETMFCAVAHNWVVNRSELGVDGNNADGWSFDWTPQDLINENYYYFYAEGTDNSSLSDGTTLMLRYDCSGFYLAGDYNNDGLADILDFNYLADYYLFNGQAPVGGLWRADSNCDGYLNITDLIYYINYLFGTASAPCN